MAAPAPAPVPVSAFGSVDIIRQRRLTIYFVVHDKKSETDFKEIIFKKNQSTLFIYNENFTSYRNQNNVTEGGGNGFLRKYRKDNNKYPYSMAMKEGSNIEVHVNALGIPTGQSGQTASSNSINGFPINFSKPHQMDYTTYNGLVEASIINIFNFIGFNNITEIYLSSNDSYNGLGLGIFSDEPWTKQNIKFINHKLISMLRKLNHHYDLELKSITNAGTSLLVNMLAI